MKVKKMEAVFILLAGLFVSWCADGQRIVCANLYDISEARLETNLHLGSFNLVDVDFTNDGTKMYVLDNGRGRVLQYDTNQNSPFDLRGVTSRGAVYTFPSSHHGRPSGFALSDDDSKLYVVGHGGSSVNKRTIYQYDLTTPGDVRTARYNNVSYTLASGSSIADVDFSRDGTKMFTTSGRTMWAFDLTTAWNISTAVNGISISLSDLSVQTGSSSLGFNKDGTQMFSIDSSRNTMYRYDLSTAWDISTASYSNVGIGIVGSQSRGLEFSDTGHRFFISSDGHDRIYQYNLGPAFDNYLEVLDNDGTIMTNEVPLTFAISGDTFLDADGDDVLDGGFTVANLPTGLTARFILSQGDTVAELELSGTALDHDDTDGVANLGVSIDASAATGGTATVDCTATVGLDFLDNVPVHFMRHGKRFVNGAEKGMRF